MGSDPGRSFAVLKPGMLTTVQDLGRAGYQGLGVPVSGPMDAYSHRLANAVLGNDSMAAALEITLLGPELLAEGDLTCAIAGAEIEVTVDGTTAPRHQPFMVPSGSRLRCGASGLPTMRGACWWGRGTRSARSPTGWDTASTGRPSVMPRLPTSCRRRCRSARSRYPPRGSRFCSWRSGRPRAAMRRSPTSSLRTCRSRDSSRLATGSRSRRSRALRRWPRCAPARRRSRDEENFGVAADDLATRL